MTYQELEQVYAKWMHLHDPDMLRLIYATIIAHRFQGNPVWLLIIGPASCGKTEMLISLENSDMIYPVSTMTKAAVASGFGDGMQSFCFQADGKVVTLKDFSATAEMHSETRAELFGALREIYDGSYIRKTGRTEINWHGKISILAGATPAIESQRKMDAALGERFITMRVTCPTENDLNIMLDKDTSSTIHKIEMRQELSNAAVAFVKDLPLTPVANIHKSTLVLIRNASKCIAKLRTSVTRNTYSKEIEYPLEVGEMPMRLNSQFTLLALGLYNLPLSEPEVNRVIYRLMTDGIPYTRYRVVLAIAKGLQTQQMIAQHAKLSQGMVSRLLEELMYLDIVSNSGRTLTVVDDILKTALLCN